MSLIRGRSDDVARALVQMRLSMDKVRTAPDLDTVRGHEGAAAAAYFGVLDELIRADGIRFPGRVRRPPTDPANILLSFGYTLLTRLMHGALEIAGLDPYLGALHARANNRPSLALDLIEELRPVIVDTVVLSTLNKRIVRAADFLPVEDEDAPIEELWEREENRRHESADDVAATRRRTLVLSQEGVRRWLVQYERRLQEISLYAPQARQLSYRQIVQEQVYRFARQVRGEEEYQPYLAED